MPSLLAKKFPSLISSSDQYVFLLRPFIRISKLSTQTETQSQDKQRQETHFIAQYLISSFGFSRDRAVKASKNKDLAAIRSLERPDSVLSFLKKTGLSDTQIKSLISWSPQLLAANVKEVLEPRARELMAHGFTGETLVQVIRSNPNALKLKSAVPRLKFWRDFLSNNESTFLKVLKRNRTLAQYDIEKKVIPCINVLREYGLSDKKIAVVVQHAGFTLQNPDYLRQLLERTESIGFLPSSGMFVYGLNAMGKLKQDALEKKFDFFRKTFGWSEEETHTVFKVAPLIFNSSDKILKSKVDFLVGNAGLNPQKIVSQPILLSYSLEKRMVPRHYVLTVLKSKGLMKNSSLSSYTILMTDKDFVERFIVPYQKELPELYEKYAAACSGKMPI